MIDLERKSGIPLYVQVAQMISGMIGDGTWAPGFRLPPERQMAQLLGVSRNTVSASYAYLENRGLVYSSRGRGTFVIGDQPEKDMETENGHGAKGLSALADVLFQLGIQAGMDPAQTAALVQERVSLHQARSPAISIGLVECNREQLDFFSQKLNLGGGVRVVPILWPGEERGREILDHCAGVDLVVTTFFHLEEVSRCLGLDLEVLGIALDPDLETMVRIAQLPRGSKVALVCLSHQFAERVKKSLQRAGLGHLEVEVLTPGQPLEPALKEVGGVIVSPGRREEVKGVSQGTIPVIEFIYYPDQGSIRMLSQRISELMERGRANPVLGKGKGG